MPHLLMLSNNIERVYDDELFRTAKGRLKNYPPADTILFETVAAKNGIDLAALPKEDIELE